MKIPADYYDTLEFAALALDGIGGGTYSIYTRSYIAPNCALGCFFTDISNEVSVIDILYDLGLTPALNDSVVSSINRRRGGLMYERVPFEAYVKEMGLERGE